MTLSGQPQWFQGVKTSCLQWSPIVWKWKYRFMSIYYWLSRLQTLETQESGNIFPVFLVFFIKFLFFWHNFPFKRNFGGNNEQNVFQAADVTALAVALSASLSSFRICRPIFLRLLAHTASPMYHVKRGKPLWGRWSSPRCSSSLMFGSIAICLYFRFLDEGLCSSYSSFLFFFSGLGMIRAGISLFSWPYFDSVCAYR